MSVLIKGLNLKPCKDGFDGKGLVIIGYDDKLYAVAHEQIIPLPDDAVPVVRCKDCEFYTEDERWCRRLGLVGAFDPNGYCSHAERSEDE